MASKIIDEHADQKRVITGLQKELKARKNVISEMVRMHNENVEDVRQKIGDKNATIDKLQRQVNRLKRNFDNFKRTVNQNMGNILIAKRRRK